MRLFILAICALSFGVFVYWRVSLARELVKPNQQTIDDQTQQVQTGTNNYTEPIENLKNSTRDAYNEVE